MAFVLAFDVTGANLQYAPGGVQLAGYDTGGSGIAWPPAGWTAHPGSIHISQQPALGADKATYPDVLDVENGAATFSDAGPWAAAMQAAYKDGKRPGQREPAVYMSASNVTAVVNSLKAEGITSGVGLWIANWNLTQAQAIADVLNAAGPFPVIGIQFKMDGPYDSDVFSAAWVSTVSKSPSPPPPPPPADGASVTVVGMIIDGAWPRFEAADHYVIEYDGVKVLSLPAGTDPEVRVEKLLIPGPPSRTLDVYAIAGGKPHLLKSETL